MEFNQEVKLATDPIYNKISKVMPEIEWAIHAPYVHKINKLKKPLSRFIRKFLRLFLKSNGLLMPLIFMK